MVQQLVKKWFVVQIKPNSYKSAIENLERQGFETFLPKMQITQKQKNKFLVKNVYVFPGYMFVCFNPHIISWTKINSTYGVSKIIAFNCKPSEISPDFVQELKIRYEVNSNQTKKEKLQKGDSIKFFAGPFTDLIAKIECIEENKRIWVLLEAMGGYQRLKLHRDDKLNIIKLTE